MHLIGIDHGTKRCGIAVSIAGVALPKMIVPTGLVLHALEKLKQEYTIHTFVLGAAPHLSGVKSNQLGIQQDFASTLQSHFPDCTVVFHNEGFSSKQARFELESRGLPSDGNIDDQAAAIILQDYIDHL